MKHLNNRRDNRLDGLEPLDGLDDRLDEHFRDHRAVPVGGNGGGPGIGVVMARGRRIRRRRTLAIAGAGMLVVVALVIASLSTLRRPQATLVPSRATDTPAQRAQQAEFPAATSSATGISWSADESTTPNVSTEIAWNSVGGGASVYALGTAATPKGQPAQSQIFRTDDGITFAPTGPSFDPWITSLDDDGARIYALGTAPVAGDVNAFGYQLAISTDSAVTWDASPLPVDYSTVRAEVGSAGSVGTQVVAGEGSVLAMVNLVAYGDPSAALPGNVDAPFGSVVTADGIDVFGPPTDLEAVAATVCPDGWPLKEGQPRIPAGDNSAGVANTVAVGFPGPNQSGVWHCESPDGNSDLWIESSQVHGDVARSVAFGQLDISSDSIKALRGEPRMFRSTNGGSWAEVTLPRQLDLHNSSSPQLLWTGSRYVFVVATGTEGTVLFSSADGVTWTEGDGPDQLVAPSLAALPDGSLLAIAQAGGRLIAGHSSDDLTWTYASLDAMLQLDPTWRASLTRTVSGPVGTAVIVSAQRDIVAAYGGLQLKHDHFTLRYTDSQGTLQLLDSGGTVLDTRQSWGQPNTAGGWIQFPQMGSGGITIVDPTTGERVDSFSQAASDAMWNDFYNSAEGQKAQSEQQPTASWVLDTVDGSGWAMTPFSQLGLSSLNSYPSTVAATAASLQFGFLIPKADGTGATAATLVGVGS